jgi:hypothetical protein
VLEHARFDVIGEEAFSAEPLAELGLIASEAGAGTGISADVSSAILEDIQAGALAQYRLRFEDVTDDDNTSDVVMSDWETQRLDVSYLIP